MATFLTFMRTRRVTARVYGYVMSRYMFYEFDTTSPEGPCTPVAHMCGDAPHTRGIAARSLLCTTMTVLTRKPECSAAILLGQHATRFWSNVDCASTETRTKYRHIRDTSWSRHTAKLVFQHCLAVYTDLLRSRTVVTPGLDLSSFFFGNRRL